MNKIRKGDQVIVLTGRDKGKRGTVSRRVDEQYVLVEGVNIVKKHIKRGRARQAGIVEVEAALHVSNVMLICPSCKQPTRVGVHSGADGKNVRFCKKCNKDIPRPDAG